MPQLSPLRLTGARALIGNEMGDQPITLAEGRIADGAAPELDLTGYLVLPGIIDLHGDGFERHLTPRPSAPFDKRRALHSAMAELAVNGVTTAWFAQSWSWEGGFRSGEATCALLEALSAEKAALLADVRVQIRLETHVIDAFAEVEQAVAQHGVDYVVFNDHLPEAVEMADHQPARFAQWAAQTKRSAEEMLAIVRGAQEKGAEVPAALGRISTALKERGVRMGSHDDGTADVRHIYRSLGADVCEFPTTFAAAEAARAAGEPVLMGAPNVVRLGSQSGNIAAQSLIEAGLCDALVSDYYYPALAQAAWHLVDTGVMDLPAAWGLISTRPAQIMGLSDRGHLGQGARADVIAVNAETRKVEMTVSAGRLAHLSGALAARAWDKVA